MKLGETFYFYRPFLNFLIVGIAAFALFIYTQGLPLVFLLIGPAIYIADMLQNVSLPLVRSFAGTGFNFTPFQLDYFVLLPATLLYFGLIGFLLSHLLRDEGWLRNLTILALFAFAGFLHYMAWQQLEQFYIPRY